MTPTDKDIAEFVVLALKYKFLGLPQIVAWGDEVIKTRDDPPTWALDLSMADNEEAVQSVFRQMHCMRGDLTPLMPERLLVALMKRDWQSGKLQWEQVWRPLWDIILEKDVRLCRGLPFVDVELIRELYGLIDWRAVCEANVKHSEIETLVDKIFATCEPNVILLPYWA